MESDVTARTRAAEFTDALAMLSKYDEGPGSSTLSAGSAGS